MKWWHFILSLIFFVSCAGGKGAYGIKCAKNKPRKTKQYRVKKMKNVYRPVYSASGGSATSNQETVQKEEISEPNDSSQIETASAVLQDTLSQQVILVNNPVEIESFPENEAATEVIDSPEPPLLSSTIDKPEPVNRPPEINNSPIVENVTSQPKITSQPNATPNAVQENEDKPIIDEPKINLEVEPLATIPSNFEATNNADKVEVFLSFREQEINISKGYEFDEFIPFVINKDRLLNKDEAFGKIEDLSILLKENPQVHVTIIANTATDEPHPAHSNSYGSDMQKLSELWEQEIDSTAINDGHSFTLKELMIARGKRIEEVLIENGVNAEQISYKHGSHNMWKFQRVVTFILKETE